MVMKVLKTSVQMLNFFTDKTNIKVSEYPFKQNRNMLKNMTVILYTYFLNISLYVLRPTFFNTCNWPFLSSLNIRKMRFKVGPKTNYFSYFMSSCTNRVPVSKKFFHWYLDNQKANKTLAASFFLLNIFWIISF